MSDMSLPQLLGLLDVLVTEVGDNFHRALVTHSLPILLLQVGSHFASWGPRITFLQTRGEAVSHLNTWIEYMSEDCFESLINQILPKGVLHVNPTPDLVY